MSERTGQCLCGAVKISATVEGGIQACHCIQCQRWTGGGPYMAAHVSDLVIEGEDSLESYRASDWGERVNCATCGSILWWKMQGKVPKSIAAGLLDDQSGMTVTEEIFVDHRPGWLPVWDGAAQSTESEEKAKLDAYLARQE